MANGYIGYFGIGCAFFVACWVNNLLISYVVSEYSVRAKGQR